MDIIIFIIILSVLVFVHEAGHFIAAKSFGIRVDEFGLGYPPRAKKLFRWSGTDFTLNWLPFGGFVKIFGEDASEEAAKANNSFVSKNRFKQGVVLVSGVIGNFILAGVLLSIGFMIGMSSPVGLGLPQTNIHTTITEVLPNSPASASGLKEGDEILLITRAGIQAPLDPEGAANFISSSETPVSITVERSNEIFTKSVTPANGVIEGKLGVGFGLAEVSITKLGFFKAVYEGFRATVILTGETAKALALFFGHAIIGRADLSQVTGPVGLVSVTGEAAGLGFVYLLSFAALISINLSIVNLLPFPALDGGRLLFVIIEGVIRRPIPARVANTINTVGFALLILLMIVITIKDISNIL